MSVAFVVPDVGHVSGGSLYNERVRAAWPGQPPSAVVADPESLAAACRRADVVLVDGLLGCRNPSALAAARADGHRIVLLVHMPQPDTDGGLGATATRAEELAALQAADVVVATSQHTATILRVRCPGLSVVVATPGVQPAPVAAEHDPPTLLCVGSVGPLKNQGLVVEAAGRCAELPFTLRIVGPLVDPDYAARWQQTAESALPGRVEWTGALTGAELEAAYAGADLALSVAHAEAYGMTVLEALAHGIPVIAGRGTGAVEALTAGGGVPGAQVFTDRPGELADLLRVWLTDPALRRRWRRSALGAREHLPRWSDAAARLAALTL